jgi:hypothetical protein
MAANGAAADTVTAGPASALAPLPIAGTDNAPAKSAIAIAVARTFLVFISSLHPPAARDRGCDPVRRQHCRAPLPRPSSPQHRTTIARPGMGSGAKSALRAKE